MAHKLKNMAVTSVDLVDQGANPDAYIRLFKRKPEMRDEEPAESEKGLFKKFANWLAKGGEDAAQTPDDKRGNQEGVQKGAKLFAEQLSKEMMRRITGEMFDFCYALSDSLASIICDNDLTADSKQSMMTQSLKEFNEAMDKAVASWAKGKEAKEALNGSDAETGITKSTAQKKALSSLLAKHGLGGTRTEEMNKSEKEVCDTMKIDKSKMSQEEVKILEEFEKKYGAEENQEENPAPSNDLTKGTGGNPNRMDGVEKNADPETAEAIKNGTASMNPEVARAIEEMNKAYEAQTKQLEELQKNLEMQTMKQIAKRYEPLGKKTDELAEKLYELKKAGGTVYNDYVALLDENLTMIGKSNLFGEIGSNREGGAGSVEAIGVKASEIKKSAEGTMTNAEALIKAFEENPELAAQYEQEYMRG